MSETRHVTLPYSFSTCIKPKTNGVFRPKTLTITVNFFFSLFTSSMTPVNPLKGP